MTKLKLTLLLLIIYTSINLQAQTPGTTLTQQHQDVVLRSGSWQGFKQIRQDKIDRFWRNIQDTLTRQKQLTREANAKVLSSAKTVDDAKAELQTAQQQLEEARSSVNEVSLLGIPLEKGTYNLIMWGLVLLLAAALTFAIYRSRSALTEAHYRTGLYNELSEEFQKYKVSANDKEKKLARELQTERNRIAEMTGR